MKKASTAVLALDLNANKADLSTTYHLIGFSLDPGVIS